VEDREKVKAAPDVLRAVAWQGALSQHIYQDGLMWSRMQTLGVLQAAIVSAQYGLGPRHIVAVWVVAILGAALTLVLLQLAVVDEKVRDANLEVMRSVLQEFDLPEPQLTENGTRGFGGWSLRIVMSVFILVDLGVAVVFSNCNRLTSLCP
jgi:hypothetical protein